MLLAQKQLQDFIKSNALFKPADKILLAVSGGKDSVAMAYLFHKLGYNFAIAHCNFNLRGEESERDQRFVEKLAKDFKVALYLKNFETQAFATSNKISIQMAARDLRYGFFEEVRESENFNKIAIAQHQNDAIETMMINLIRGTGIAGLHGIKAIKNHLIRPMLCFTSDDILAIISQNNLDFVEDSSNAANKYMRNKIRLDIIPEMKKLNPSLEETFQNNLQYFTELEELLHNQVNEISSKILIENLDGYKIKIVDIKKLHPKQLLLFEILKPFKFNLTSIKDLINALDGISGKQFFSEDYQIIIDREQLLIKRKVLHQSVDKLIEQNQEKFSFGNYFFNKKILDRMPSSFKSHQNMIYVDADLLVYPLTIRNWQQGDSFKPFGMKGVKKLSDFFINQKVNIQQKANIPILIDGDGKIIWVCGLRGDDRFKVNANTKKIIIFEVENV